MRILTLLLDKVCLFYGTIIVLTMRLLSVVISWIVSSGSITAERVFSPLCRSAVMDTVGMAR